MLVKASVAVVTLAVLATACHGSKPKQAPTPVIASPAGMDTTTSLATIPLDERESRLGARAAARRDARGGKDLRRFGRHRAGRRRGAHLGHRCALVRDARSRGLLRRTFHGTFERPLRGGARARRPLRADHPPQAPRGRNAGGHDVSRAHRERLQSARVLERGSCRTLAIHGEHGERNRSSRGLVDR